MTGSDPSFLLTIKDLSQLDLDTDQSITGDKEIVFTVKPGALSSISIEDEHIVVLGFDKAELRMSMIEEDISALFHVLSKRVKHND